MHKARLHLCKDGTHTLYSERYDQFFHNPNGAVGEARHVFFEIPGLYRRIEQSNGFRLLEIGFGTGLNLLLLMEFLNKIDAGNPRKEGSVKVTYTSVEANPLTTEQAVKLNYPGKIDLSNGSEILACIFNRIQPGVNQMSLNRTVDLKLIYSRFDQISRPDEPYDAILFDPFSPEVNSELWTREVFQKLAEWSDPDVLLSTYCAASKARGAMAAAGWHIASAQGALGKREMTIASLNPKNLTAWKPVNRDRLAKRYFEGDF